MERLRFDENALAGTFLGGLDYTVKLAVGKVGHAFCALGVALGCCKNLVLLT
jgi:hypothetical protein